MDQIKMDHSEVRYFIHGKIDPKSHPNHPEFAWSIFFFPNSDVSNLPNKPPAISTNFRATDLIKQVEWM